MFKKIRSRAPLRLGLGGGGTDVSPYSELYGGNVLNATINLFARCTLSTDTASLTFEALDLGLCVTVTPERQVLEKELVLHKAIYNRMMVDFNNSEYIPLKISTSCDAPFGSGLGSSSTLVVAMIKAYQFLLRLPLDDYEIAHLAFEIERDDCGFLGGKQDQYSATFGGVNFIDFKNNGHVIVNPLRINDQVMAELEDNMILFFTGTSRSSERIISDQVQSLDSESRLSAMHKIKETAVVMKECLLKSDLESYFSIQKNAWDAKKSSSKLVSNSLINSIAEDVMGSGAHGLKVSGAGGGGFMIIYCDPSLRYKVLAILAAKYEGSVFRFGFTIKGAEAWKVD